jgi:hypothetical protein
MEASRQQFGAKRAEIEASIMTELTLEHEQPPAEPKPRPQYGPARRAPNPSTMPTMQQSPPVQRAASESIQPAPVESVQRAPIEARQSDFREREPRPVAPARQERVPERQSSDTRPPQRTTPPVQQKTAEDLKSILRKMTSESQKKPVTSSNKSSDTDPKKKTENSTLKGALADILQKQAPVRHNEQPAAPQSPAPVPTPKTEKKFEVPEETLRAIFKEQ